MLTLVSQDASLWTKYRRPEFRMQVGDEEWRFLSRWHRRPSFHTFPDGENGHTNMSLGALLLRLERFHFRPIVRVKAVAKFWPQSPAQRRLLPRLQSSPQRSRERAVPHLLS